MTIDVVLPLFEEFVIHAGGPHIRLSSPGKEK